MPSRRGASPARRGRQKSATPKTSDAKPAATRSRSRSLSRLRAAVRAVQATNSLASLRKELDNGISTVEKAAATVREQVSGVLPPGVNMGTALVSSSLDTGFAWFMLNVALTLYSLLELQLPESLRALFVSGALDKGDTLLSALTEDLAEGVMEAALAVTLLLYATVSLRLLSHGRSLGQAAMGIAMADPAQLEGGRRAPADMLHGLLRTTAVVAPALYVARSESIPVIMAAVVLALSAIPVSASGRAIPDFVFGTVLVETESVDIPTGQDDVWGLVSAARSETTASAVLRDGGGSDSSSSGAGGVRDAFWAVAWLAAAVGVPYGVAEAFPEPRGDSQLVLPFTGTPVHDVWAAATDHSTYVGAVLTSAVAFAGIAIVATRAAVRALVWGDIAALLSLFTYATIQMWSDRRFLPSAGMLVVTMFLARLAWTRRSQLDLTCRILQEACTGVVANIGLVLVPIAIQVPYTLYQIWWYNIFNNIPPASDSDGGDDGGVSTYVSVAMVLVLLWTHMTLCAAMSIAASATVSAWYFRGSKHASRSVLPGLTRGLRRAFVTNFGSAALAGLVLVLASLVRQAQRKVDEARRKNVVAQVLLWVFSWLLGLMAAVVQHTARYAIVYTGVYGDAFAPAASKAWALTQKATSTVLVTSHYGDSVARFMGLAATALYAAVAITVATDGAGVADVEAMTAALGDSVFATALFVGVWVVVLSFELVVSAADTVMVCVMEEASASPDAPKSWHAGPRLRDAVVSARAAPGFNFFKFFVVAVVWVAAAAHMQQAPGGAVADVFAGAGAGGVAAQVGVAAAMLAVAALS